MCSITEGSIERIAAAIDQVAGDIHGPVDEPELTARIAEIWLMIQTLDPSLARRQRGYVETAAPDRQR